ncbi:ATPase [Erythrobacter arachoides]|uniref:ATPase n=1 Tax=Aurantiacibacter arachoides TaxID=1850444 RepID=A0A845A3D4_9SPHN|nr:DnaA/Hda family protein [Aurantiacibacter arachoides]MXO93646.1 ATPase [Aurantiacibacter arachoides]GGD47783.1 regulatory inactivation of DnaA Hda protein [Aurantiacibacter arachoides]
MEQIALPLKAGRGPARIVVGAANAHIAEALVAPASWPFRTAVLTGPPRSGKSLFARWFAESGAGEALDDADDLPEDTLFHRWNRAQESGTALLIVGGAPPWDVTLPDLRSRLAGSFQLEIGQPDDDMARELLLSMAEQRGLPLRTDAADYLVPRAPRSAAELESLVETIDRLSLERKSPPNLGIWRSALEALHGPDEPRLL